MIVVTSGSKYLDIDAYAGCIAYAELLRLQGSEAVAVSTAPINESVTQKLRNLEVGLDDYTPQAEDTFVMIDVSNADFFDTFVGIDQVDEILDHHPGHEQFWADKIGDKAQIEPVGAACTQVVERWQQVDKLDMLNPSTATLLAAGILDNTLNFTAKITHQRDHDAYSELQKIAGLDDAFAAEYFSDVQTTIEADLQNAMINDVKQITETDQLSEYLGQVVVWDAADLLDRRLLEMSDAMRSLGTSWAINVVSIKDNTTNIVAEAAETQDAYSSVLGVEFVDGSVSDPIPAMLRKEIMKKGIDRQ